MNHPIDRLAPLVEPARRRVWDFVTASEASVTREQVADGTGLSLALATFHLERLLEAGLLESSFGAVDGARRRGRPTKLYRPSRTELSVSLPARDYRLAAELFAAALPPEPLPEALDEAAHERGREIGRGARAGLGERAADGVSDRTGLVAALAGQGYEPQLRDDGSVALRNCPFLALVEGHRDLMCPTNRALLEGLLEGLAGGTVPDMQARLEPGEGRCCVLIGPVHVDPAPAE